MQADVVQEHTSGGGHDVRFEVKSQPKLGLVGVAVQIEGQVLPAGRRPAESGFGSIGHAVGGGVGVLLGIGVWVLVGSRITVGMVVGGRNVGPSSVLPVPVAESVGIR